MFGNFAAQAGVVAWNEALSPNIIQPKITWDFNNVLVLDFNPIGTTNINDRPRINVWRSVNGETDFNYLQYISGGFNILSPAPTGFIIQSWGDRRTGTIIFPKTSINNNGSIAGVDVFTHSFAPIVTGTLSPPISEWTVNTTNVLGEIQYQYQFIVGQKNPQFNIELQYLQSCINNGSVNLPTCSSNQQFLYEGINPVNGCPIFRCVDSTELIERGLLYPSGNWINNVGLGGVGFWNFTSGVGSFRTINNSNQLNRQSIGDESFFIVGNSGQVNSSHVATFRLIPKINPGDSLSIDVNYAWFGGSRIVEFLGPQNSNFIYRISHSNQTANRLMFTRPEISNIAISPGRYQTAVANVLGRIHVSTDFGQNWIEKDEPRDWRGVAISDNALIQTAVARNGFIYVSQDSGNTWSQRTSTQRGWNHVAMSANGMIQTAVMWSGDQGQSFIENNPQIFRSLNGGLSWAPITGGQNWFKVAMSSDGAYQTIVAYGEGIFVSDAFGLGLRKTFTGGFWVGIDMSANGQIQTAVAASGPIHRSVDYGNTWSIVNNNSLVWSDVAVSNDGKYQTATVYNGRIYVSNDSGINWTEKGPAQNNFWESVSVDGDGQYQSAVGLNTQIYVSSDFGETWSPRDSARGWKSIAIADTSEITSLSNPAVTNLEVVDDAFGKAYTFKIENLTDGYSFQVYNYGNNFGNNSQSLENNVSQDMVAQFRPENPILFFEDIITGNNIDWRNFITGIRLTANLNNITPIDWFNYGLYFNNIIYTPKFSPDPVPDCECSTYLDCIDCALECPPFAVCSDWFCFDGACAKRVTFYGVTE